jgi:hypothetical protein
MYEGNNKRDDDPRPPSMGEIYAVGIGASNLRVGNDSNIRTPGDMVAAAGMNKHRMGLSLARLMSEWERGATPKAVEVPHEKRLSQVAAEARWKEAPGVYRRVVHEVDLKTAEAEGRRRSAESVDWQQKAHVLRFLRLKTLPTVRAGLLQYVEVRGWDGGEHLVAATIKRYLSPKCPVCEGRKKRVIAGTGRTGSRDCGECKGTGDAKIPHGGAGRALLQHIRACIGTAMADLREGAGTQRRSDASNHLRDAKRGRDTTALLARVDAEATADAAQDTAAIREQFRLSLGKRKRPNGSWS